MTAAAGCGWTASANAPWLAIAPGASGSGNGTVQVAIEVNGAGAAQSGSATIAGRTFTVNQGSGCSFTINPTAQTVPAAGGSVTVSVGARRGRARGRRRATRHG